MTSQDADDILRDIVHKLAEKKMRASDLFRKIDVSGDGTLEADELKAGFRDLGFALTDEEFATIVPRFDKDGGGDVSLREFERAMKAAEKLGPKKREETKEPVKPVKKKQGLTEEDREEFRQIFCLFKQLCRQEVDDDGNELPLVTPDNADKDGIKVHELEQLLETVGMKTSPQEFQAMVEAVDKNGDGEISFEEFVDQMARRVQVPHHPDEISAAFQAFSRKAPEGLIRVQDLRNALSTYMHKELSPGEVEELLSYYKDSFVRIPDSDQDYFNFQDYIELMAPDAAPIVTEGGADSAS
jgi:calmodulin